MRKSNNAEYIEKQKLEDPACNIYNLILKRHIWPDVAKQTSYVEKDLEQD